MVKALARIAPGTKSADAALAALIEALDSRVSLQKEVVEALPAFGAKAARAIPRLRELRKPRGGPGVHQSAGVALDAIEAALSEGRGPSADSPIPTAPDRGESHERRTPE
jgi:hypothetical protein